MRYLQDTEIELDEYAFKSIPGLVLYNAWLSVAVDRSCSRGGEWLIDTLSVDGFDKNQPRVTYKKGDWLFDTICKEITNDIGWQDLITRQCADE